MFSTKIAALREPLQDDRSKRILKKTEHAVKPESHPDLPQLKPADQSKMLDLVMKNDFLIWDRSMVAKYACHSEILTTFFENPNQKALHHKWTQDIKKLNAESDDKTNGIPDIPVSAYDGSETHTIFDHYRSSYYTNLFSLPRNGNSADGTERMWLLTEAVRLGSFNAISLRCALTVKNLLKSDVLPEEKKLIEQKDTLSKDAKIILERAVENKKENMINQTVMKDCERLCKLYGAIGYAMAGKQLYNLSDLYLSQKDKEKKARGREIFDEAIKNFICAAKLETEPYSITLANTILKGRNLIEALGLRPILKDATNGEEAMLVMSSWYREKAAFEAIIKRATDEIETRAQGLKNREAKDDVKEDDFTLEKNKLEN